jgi:hypothetical protein
LSEEKDGCGREIWWANLRHLSTLGYLFSLTFFTFLSFHNFLIFYDLVT